MTIRITIGQAVLVDGGPNQAPYYHVVAELGPEGAPALPYGYGDTGMNQVTIESTMAHQHLLDDLTLTSLFDNKYDGLHAPGLHEIQPWMLARVQQARIAFNDMDSVPDSGLPSPESMAWDFVNWLEFWFEIALEGSDPGFYMEVL